MVSISHPQRHVLVAPRLLVVDLEMTCGLGVTMDVQDIIEVGTCVLELGSPVSAEDSASVFVRPVRSRVTQFCTKLTGITPERVANAPNFAATAPRLNELVRAVGAAAWVTWGQDQTLMHRQCLASEVPNPFDGLLHVDIKRLMTPLLYQLTGGAKPQGAGAGVGLKTALTQLGLEFIGRHHGGAADAFNTARLLEEVRRRAGAHLAKSTRPRRRP